MKRFISKILILILCISCCIGYTNAVDFSDINENCTKYINSFKDSDHLCQNEFYKFLFLKHDIDPELINYVNFKNSYSINEVKITANITRTTAIIGLMRSYKLIPDPDNITFYQWEDTPSNLSKQELAYISYARQLGITKGITLTKFGFMNEITIKQLKAFIHNIESIKNLKNLQVSCKLKITSKKEIGNIYQLVEPLLIEYLYSLPDNVESALIRRNWKIILCNNLIPGYEGTSAIGLTRPDRHEIYLVTTSRSIMPTNFNSNMIHEFGHAIYNIAGSPSISSKILKTEKPKLAKEYRSYAGVNKHEYIACAWVFMNQKGDEYFSQNYPETYKLFKNMISRMK